MLQNYSNYLRSGSDTVLHLTSFIVKPNPNILDRICLILYLIAITCAGIVLVMFLIQHDQYNSTQYRIENDYLHWKTPIPAISVCENPNDSTIFQFSTSTAKSLDEQNQVAKFYKSLLRPTFEHFFTNNKEKCEYCPLDNYTTLVHKNLTKDCQRLFKSCYWNRKEFKCCENFQLLMTQHAKCYTLNSYYTNQSRDSDIFIVSGENKEGHLILSFTSPVQVYVHDKSDVSFMKNQLGLKTPQIHKLPNRVNVGQKGNIEYTMREILSDSTAHLLTLSQRKCILPKERKLKYYSRYSLSACRTECKIAKQMKLCNCTHHLIAKPGLPSCNFTGLQCLHSFLWNPEKKVRSLVKKINKECKCMPDCEFTEINTVRNTIDTYQKDHILASVKMTTLPSERLILHSRVNTLEMIVGLACISRIFTSASLIQMLQTAYIIMTYLYFCIKEKFKQTFQNKLPHQSKALRRRPIND